MIIEGLIGFAAILGITIAVTKFVLEAMNMPEITEEEWELERAKNPAGYIELGNIIR